MTFINDPRDEIISTQSLTLQKKNNCRASAFLTSKLCAIDLSFIWNKERRRIGCKSGMEKMEILLCRTELPKELEILCYTVDSGSQVY